MPRSAKQKAIRLEKRRDRQHSPAPSSTSTLLEEQVDVSISNQIEEVQPPVSVENLRGPIQNNTANSDSNILSNPNEFVNSEQVTNIIPSGYQNGPSSLLIPSADTIASTVFNNKKHNFEKQNNSIMCTRCGMSQETAGLQCEGNK
jgi:hypothetical protein